MTSPPSRTISAHGITLRLRPGWDANIRLPSAAAIDAPPSLRTDQVIPIGGTTNAMLHAATVPLGVVVADYGGGVVERLGRTDAFVAVVGFDPEAASTELFRRTGVPRLTDRSFRPEVQQRVLPNASGAQVFFQVAGRPFCLYVVVGNHALRHRTVARVNQLLGGLTIT